MYIRQKLEHLLIYGISDGMNESRKKCDLCTKSCCSGKLLFKLEFVLFKVFLDPKNLHLDTKITQIAIT